MSFARSLLDKWIYFLKNTEQLEFIPENLKQPKELEEAFEIVTQIKWGKKEMEVYEYMEKKERDERSVLETAKKKGIKQGFEKGIKEGLQKGKEVGLQEGEKKAKIEIAKNLLKNNIDIEVIQVSTGLSKEEIDKIKR